MSSGGSRLERETIILFNEEEDTAEVYTASQSIYRKMIKRGYKADEDLKDGAIFYIPKCNIRLPNKGRKRKLQKDQIQKMQEGLKKYLERES